MNTGMILARRKKEEDESGKDKIIAKKSLLASDSPRYTQPYRRVTEVSSFLKPEN